MLLLKILNDILNIGELIKNKELSNKLLVFVIKASKGYKENIKF